LFSRGWKLAVYFCSNEPCVFIKNLIKKCLYKKSYKKVYIYNTNNLCQKIISNEKGAVKESVKVRAAKIKRNLEYQIFTKRELTLEQYHSTRT